jgi:hypothetical protein
LRKLFKRSARNHSHSRYRLPRDDDTPVPKLGTRAVFLAVLQQALAKVFIFSYFKPHENCSHPIWTAVIINKTSEDVADFELSEDGHSIRPPL